jgi:hypothetical protein
MFGFDKKKVDKKDVGAKIRKIRLEKDLTLDEFSKRIDTQLNNVHLWEKGKFLPRKAMILKICEIGGITPVELLRKSTEIDKKVEKMIEDFLGLPAKKQREFLEKIIAEEKKKEQNLK